VLPAEGDRYSIESTDALTKRAQPNLQAALDDYSKYFDTLGFSVPSKKVPVRVEVDLSTRKGWLSYFDPSTETIVIAPRREYTHFVLLKQRPSTDDFNKPDLYVSVREVVESDESFVIHWRHCPASSIQAKTGRWISCKEARWGAGVTFSRAVGNRKNAELR
jgi:hypothetical protein